MSAVPDRQGKPAGPDDERDRICEAMIDVVIESGNDGATADAATERAGLEPAAFDRHFSSAEDCVLQAYWKHTDEFTDRVEAAFNREDRWRDSLRAAAYEAAAYVRENPRIVRFGTVQMFQVGPMAQAQRESHLHRMVDMIDAGRQELDDPDEMGRGVAEGVFGSIYAYLVKEVQAGRGTGSAEEFVPGLMYIAVRPYLGHEAAREELSIPPPTAR
jgi:AcrR family transcriptional regulator